MPKIASNTTASTNYNIAINIRTFTAYDRFTYIPVFVASRLHHIQELDVNRSRGDCSAYAIEDKQLNRHPNLKTKSMKISDGIVTIDEITDSFNHRSASRRRSLT
jgi:hypothetical protein